MFIGIDNGCTGTIGWVSKKGFGIVKTPNFEQTGYQKSVKRTIHRIDTEKLRELLSARQPVKMILLERPMVNPGRFLATISGIRALEATLIVVESLGLPYDYIDSKEWQKALLPEGCKGKELKAASLDVARRLFPTMNAAGLPDADGLLIAEFARRKYR